MKIFLHYLLFIIFLKSSLQYDRCRQLTIKPFEPTQVNIDLGDINCLFFTFDNPSEGSIILKLAKSNSFTTYIYIYNNENDIFFDTYENEFKNFLYQIHIGEDIFKEKKLENMQRQRYYFIIYEKDFNFNDILTIYNDKFTQNNYYELNEIAKNEKKEYNFKYEYNFESPIIMHFRTISNKVQYLNYQFVNIKDDGLTSFYIYENDLEMNDYKEFIENKKENNNYIPLKADMNYYIKIITNGETNVIFDFMENKIMKISPFDIYEKEVISQNEYYFYIEKDLKNENDEYFNEFTVKLDSINLKNLIFDITTNTCNENKDEDIMKCFNYIDPSKKTYIKRDVNIPYIYHVYYSFNNQKYVIIKIESKNSLKHKQRFTIESSGGNDFIDNYSEKLFTDNKGYLYPVYLNVSISDINGENNKNKNRLLVVNTNVASAIKIFYNENTFRNENIDTYKSEYLEIDEFFYGFDFNQEKTKKLFKNIKYITILIYSPWESYPIYLQLTFINDNVNNFKYILDNERPKNTPLEINLKSTNEKYYFIGQYHRYSKNILFNEIVYGNITSKYKFFNNEDKISHIIYNETSRGYNFTNWTPIKGRIDIIELTCISPALIYMHSIEDQAVKINEIVLEKGSQNYIYLNNTHKYNLSISSELKQSTNINIEVFIVSKRENQSIDIKINDKDFNLDVNNGNNYLRYNTNDKSLESFIINGKGTATLIRIKIGVSIYEKKVAFYKEYIKTEENNKISKKIIINISNNNYKDVKLCYSARFEEEKYIHIPKNENCFVLKENEKTSLTMFNPWNKYLINKNKLYLDSDHYYFVIYTEDESAIPNLVFNSEEEFFEINNNLNENKFVNIGKTQNNIIKSSGKEDKTILIQFSPVKMNNNKSEDKYIIKSQYDEIIQEGKIYNKNNRTFVTYPDQLVDTFLQLDIQSDNKFDIKYSVISKTYNISEDKINDNYTIELVNSDKSSTLQFKPLFKKKDIDYSIYISFDEKIDLSSVPNLSNLESNNNNLYIFKKVINTENDIIKYELEPDVSSQIIKNKKWLINVLAKEKDKYNIELFYDIIEGGTGDSGNKEKKGKSKFTLYLILILAISIAAIIGISFGIYYLYNYNKYRKINLLLKDVDNFNLSMEDQSKSNRLINDEEGQI